MSSPRLKAVIFDIGGVVVRSPLIAIAAYEKEKGLPNNYINTSITARGAQGAWQKFERGELSLFPFYEAFGRELSDTLNCNDWYRAYCRRKGIECPQLPQVLSIDGRELFGRMMRESTMYDDAMVEAIRRIRGTATFAAQALPKNQDSPPAYLETTGKWRVIALTNNYSKSEQSIIGDGPPPQDRYPNFRVESELEFLGWKDGATPQAMLALFDDFCDSSSMGTRKPEPEFYLLACRRNGVKPEECIFLDDLGLNLKAAKQLGMETIHVPIGGSLAAIDKLGQRLGIDLRGGLDVERLQKAKM